MYDNTPALGSANSTGKAGPNGLTPQSWEWEAGGVHDANFEESKELVIPGSKKSKEMELTKIT